jgi:hypothetical protein
VLGAVFAGQAGASATEGGGAGLGGVLRADVIDGVQAVFMVAAPVAALALVAVLALVEVPLRAAPGGASARPGGGAGEPRDREPVAAAAASPAGEAS